MNLETDSDCSCTCCWYQYLQNYCFKRLCTDSDEFVRLYEYTKSICDRTPARKSIRPYRPKEPKSFGNPGEKIDLDKDETEEDYYVEVKAQGLDLFASNNHSIYRSLLDHEKDNFFIDLSYVFDLNSLSLPADHDEDHPIKKPLSEQRVKPDEANIESDDEENLNEGIYDEEDYEDYEDENYDDDDDQDDIDNEDTYVSTLTKREKTKLTDEEITQTVEALKAEGRDLSLGNIYDVLLLYSTNADDFFNIIKQAFGEQYTENFLIAFEQSKQQLGATGILPEVGEPDGKLCLNELSSPDNPWDVQGPFTDAVAGCYLFVAEMYLKICDTGFECECQCGLSHSMKVCLESFGDRKYDSIVEMFNEFNAKVCLKAAEIGEISRTDTEGKDKNIAGGSKVSVNNYALNEEQIEKKVNFLTHITNVADKLGIASEVKEVENELIYKNSIQSPSLSKQNQSPNDIGPQIILDKCEMEENDLEDYMQFDLDSCDVRDLFYCKNHYKNNKCLEFEKDQNDCNNACCLEIKMAECAKSHCLSKKPVKEFQKVANLICTKYADPHVVNGKAPFPGVEDTEDVADEQTNPQESQLEARSFGGGRSGDVEDNVGKSVCKIPEFKPGYDTTKCEKKEVKQCIKDGIKSLSEDPEHFCPYCVNDNAYDECRCACCFGKYFSKVCYDPNCKLLHEKLRYKRYVREICKIRPIQYLFARDQESDFEFKEKRSNKIKSVSGNSNDEVTKKKHKVKQPKENKHSESDNRKATPAGQEKHIKEEVKLGNRVQEYDDLAKVKNATKEKSNRKSPKDVKLHAAEEIDIFSDFEDANEAKEVYLQQLPVNVNLDNLDKKRKNNIRYVSRVNNRYKRDIIRELFSEEFEDVDEDDDSNILYHEKGTSSKSRRSLKGQRNNGLGKSRAKSFAKTGSMDNKNKKRPSHIKVTVDKKQSEQAKSFGIPVKKNKFKKKMPNKPKKIKGQQNYLVEGPKFLQDSNERTETQGGDATLEALNAMSHNASLDGVQIIAGELRDSNIEASDKEQISGEQSELEAEELSSEDTLREQIEKPRNTQAQASKKSKDFKSTSIRPIDTRKLKKKVRTPKRSAELEVYPRESLYKRKFDIDAIFDDIIEDNLSSTSSKTASKSAKFKTITRTRTKSNATPSLASSKLTPTPSSSIRKQDRYGMIQFGALGLANAAGTKGGGNQTFTTTVYTDVTSHLTKTNYVTITNDKPKPTTLFDTTTEITTVKLDPPSPTPKPEPEPTKTKVPAKIEPIPSTVTSLKTRVRPTTLTETEYETYSTLTTTVWDDTLTETIPKRIFTKYKGTTTEYDTVEVTATLTDTKTKTIPNVTVTEYEESDQTITFIKTKNVTITETDFEDITTKTKTAQETVTETVANMTTTRFESVLSVTQTETETEVDERVKTKWYPEKTVTDYEEEETIWKTKWYPSTTTTTTTTTSVSTMPTTTTETTTASAGLSIPAIPLARPSPGQLKKRDVQDDDGFKVDDDLSKSEQLHVVNGTEIVNKTEKNAAADTYGTRQTPVKSEGSRVGLGNFLVTSGAISIGIIAASLYASYHSRSNDEGDGEDQDDEEEYHDASNRISIG